MHVLVIRSEYRKGGKDKEGNYPHMNRAYPFPDAKHVKDMTSLAKELRLWADQLEEADAAGGTKLPDGRFIKLPSPFLDKKLPPHLFILDLIERAFCLLHQGPMNKLLALEHGPAPEKGQRGKRRGHEFDENAVG